MNDARARVARRIGIVIGFLLLAALPALALGAVSAAETDPASSSTTSVPPRPARAADDQRCPTRGHPAQPTRDDDGSATALGVADVEPPAGDVLHLAHGPAQLVAQQPGQSF